MATTTASETLPESVWPLIVKMPTGGDTGFELPGGAMRAPDAPIFRTIAVLSFLAHCPFNARLC